MSRECRISVAMATYNGARFVSQQLTSIANQTTPVDEIVVSDDGSRDETLALVGEFRGLHNDIEVRVLKHSSSSLGPARNFQRAIEACTGDVIILADQDDLWLPQRVERGIAALHDSDALLAVSDTTLIDSNGKKLGRSTLGVLSADIVGDLAVSKDRNVRRLLRSNVFPGMSFLFRKELVDLALPIPARWLHDYWLLVVALSNSRVVIEPEPLVLYRQHDSNVVGMRSAHQPQISRLLRKLLGSRRPRTNETIVDQDAARWMGAYSRVARICGVDSRAHKLIMEKADFEVARCKRDRSGILRPCLIASSLLRGDYSRYSRWGRVGAVRDLMRSNTLPHPSSRRSGHETTTETGT